ncbi:MAG: ribonuclease R [Bacilli bacterium]|nr:ribonuclease R [Bacilli bacterium]
MENKILELINNSDRALSLEDLDKMMGFTTAEEYSELSKVVRTLLEDYKIYRSNKNRYMPIEKSPLKKGTIRMNRKGFGFVEVLGIEDVYINEVNIKDAIHNDKVIIEITNSKNPERLEGRVLKVIERELSTVVGEINFKKNKGFIKLDDDKLNIRIEIEKGKTLGAVDGHKVLVKLGNHVSKDLYLGEVIKIIGHKNDPGVDILSVVYKYNIMDTFPEEVDEELLNIPEEVLEEDLVNRKDLTNEEIFTIDGDDTKDIDDAISAKRLDNGNYELGVHIADVSYYVKENTALDVNAMDRGTSVYLVDRVIPMLPHQLSNGICSLNPEVVRLTISCVMEIDNNGNIVNYDIFPSYIKSRKQMTYKKVNSILEKNIVPEGYEEYKDTLILMEDIATVLRKAKINRGYLDFDVDEAKILVDENCHPTEIILRERGKGENLIEDFMIIANECVATHIFFMELPFIYRVHEYPKEEKIREFISYISTLGYVMEGNIKDMSPKSIQKLLNFLKDKKEFKILSSLLLRNMQKAVYRPENLGHFGLGSKCYTHFTSPIRRYPDTTVHRLLRTYLFNNDMSNETIGHWQEKLVFVSENSSARERASISCEREVEDMKMAEYMEDHIGEEFEGMISSVTNFGAFIQLDNLVEGLSHVSDMDDYYTFDEQTMTLVGERKKKRYALGDRVKIKVMAASREEKTIDFKLLGKLEDLEKENQKEEIEIL